jgi:microsomal dipeptidase-like Zn-dependent dipeptidase
MKILFTVVLSSWYFLASAQPPIIKNIPKEKLQFKDPITTNWGFENSLSAWTKTGNAFDNQPIAGNTVTSDRVRRDMYYYSGGIGGDYWQEIPYPIGVKGNQWIGTYEWNNYDAPQGTLTSKVFVLDKRYIHFLMGGGIAQNIYVSLEVKKEDYAKVMAFEAPLDIITPDGFASIRKIMNGENSELMKRQVFDIKSIALNTALKNVTTNIGEHNITARIVIADLNSGGWGHINVDDFQFTDALPEFILAGNNRYDSDMPVWGFADTHAHWVNDVGLKGLMHGKIGGNWRTSSAKNDILPCDGFNHGLPAATPGLLIAQTEKAAWNRLPERLLGDPGNLACTGLTLLGLLTPMGITGGVGVGAVGGAAAGAGAGLIGAGVTGAQASTGALDGLITGAIYGLATNPGFQSCGYQVIKDVFAKHYNNNHPESHPHVANFVDFPRWNSFFHQMMHITWVRRSYEGGQRLMVVPVGVAKSWEFNTTADGKMQSPKKYIEDAINELKRVVSENSDWLQIAYTAKEARQIILNGKMAIVIGIEHAEIGNYFDSPIDEINWLQNIGIRHFFPIHNIDNELGGAAVFNSAINSYNDLVKRESQNGLIIPLKVREGNVADDSRTNIKLERQFMRQGMRFMPLIGLGNIPFFHLNDVPAEFNYGGFVSHKNEKGLSFKGRTYINELMKRGMVIDIDHMSDLSQNETMQMSGTTNYPTISGHANFRELRRESNEVEGDGKEPKLKTEFTIYDSRVTEISNGGGMFGIMTQQNDVNDANGCPVPNNSIGGSSSFAQAYWYTFNKTGGTKGIAFGSDFNGFAPQIAPRFGVDAGFFLEGDNKRNISTGAKGEEKLRRNQAFQQEKGVKYDAPINTYHYHRFLKPAFLTSEEREIWEALAIAKSGVDPEQAWQPGSAIFVLTDPARTILQQQKIKNLAHGFRTKKEGNYIAFLDCPEYPFKLGNDCMPERKAAFMAMQPDSIHSLPASLKDGRTIELFNILYPIVKLWNQFENGPNQPLRRSYAYQGGRDFDFNIDGLAHYGMFPDLIQDLKNNGFTKQHITPLFMGPEQYIRLWEKAEAASKNIR